MKIEECDEQIVSFLNQVIQSKEFVVDDLPEKKPDKRLNKTLLRGINLNIISCQYFDGAYLLIMLGVSFSTVLTFMSEVGPEGIRKFSTDVVNQNKKTVIEPVWLDE